MPELTEEMKAVKEDKEKMGQMLAYINETMTVKIKENEVENVAALALAMENLVEKYGCQAAAIQCWNALQTEIGIMPCAANAILNEKGIPVVCETDIHGAVTALMMEAAGMGETRSFFADWTIRHPDIENGELLQHCGPSACVCGKRKKPELTYPLAFDYPGSPDSRGEARRRLLFAGSTGITESIPSFLETRRAWTARREWEPYLWVEVENIKRLEAKIVEGTVHSPLCRHSQKCSAGYCMKHVNTSE